MDAQMQRTLSPVRIFFALVVSVALLSCSDDVAGPRTSPQPTTTVGVPQPGPLSKSSPLPGSLSASGPNAIVRSASTPTASSLVGAAASTTAPATRILWQNTTTGHRSIWV